jgi:hypothetical protein
MASGDTLAVFTALNNEPPATGYATLDTRNGHVCLDFDASADEFAVFRGVLPANYAGGGITVNLIWDGTSATSGTVRWSSQFERCNTDLDTDSFATAVTGGGTANGTSGITTTTALAHTNGASIDSLAVGEMFRLCVLRDADGTSGTDDMTGDAELFAVHLKET